MFVTLRACAVLLLGGVSVASLSAFAPGSSMGGILAGICALALVAAAVHVLAWISRMPPKVADSATILIVAAGSVAAIAWSLAFDSQQGSDFGVYFRCGAELKSTVTQNIEQCQSKYIDLGDLYWRRALFYTVPFGRLISSDYTYLELLNAVLHGSAIALAAWVVRQRAGAAAALVVALLMTFFHERIYMLTLATPDNLAMLGTVVALIAIALAQEGRVSFWAAGLLGLCIVVLEYSRSTGLFVTIAAVLAVLVLAGSARRPLSNVVNVVAGIAVAVLLASALERLVASPAKGGGLLMALSALNLASLQDFTVNFPWFAYFWPEIPPGERFVVGVTKLWQEFAANGWLYPGYAFAKAQQFSAGFGYTFFATADFTSNMDTVKTVEHSSAPIMNPLNYTLLRAGLLPLLVFSTAGAWRARSEPLAVAAMAFAVALIGVLLLLTEAQPRYIIVALPALAILAGQGAATHTPGATAVRQHGLGFALVSAGLVVGGLVLAAAKATAPLPLAQAIVQSTGHCPGAKVETQPQQVTLSVPEKATCASITFMAPAAPAIGFFLTDGVYPFRSAPRPPNSAQFEIKARSGDRVEGALNQQHVIWRTLAVDPAGGDEIEFLVRRPEGASGEIKLTIAYVMPAARDAQP